ncbi:MAG: tape measure protein [Pontibacterium sp.]
MSAKNLALNLLIKAKDAASGVVSKFTNNVNKAGDAANKLDASVDQSSASVNKFAHLLTDAERAAGRAYDAQGRLREANGRFVKGAERANNRARRLSGGLGAIPNAARQAGASISGLTGRIAALAGAYVGITSVKNGLLGLLNIGGRFETLRVQINSLMGSIDEGERAVEWIKDFAKNTPLDLEGVTAGFVKLKAFGIDPMQGAYQALVDQTSKLGFSQDKLDGIITAVGQAWSKQKLQQEEVLQLAERGVPVWDLLSKATGKSVVELQKLSSAGRLGRAEIALLVQEMGRNSQGAAAAQMNTWNGLISQMRNAWIEFALDINKSGFFDYAKQQLNDVLNIIKRMTADGSLERYARNISNNLITLATNTKAIFSGVSGDLNGFMRSTGAFLGTIQVTFNALSAGIKTIGLIISANIQGMLTAISLALEAIGATDMAASVQHQANAVGAVVQAFKESVIQDSEDIQRGWKLMTGEAFDEAEAALNNLKNKATETAVAVTDVQESIVELESETDKAARLAEEAVQRQREAWQNLGLDVDVVSEAVSEQGDAAIAAFRDIALEGNASAKQIQIAFDAALAKLRTAAEIKSLIGSLKEAKNAARITGSEFTRAFNSGRTALKAVESKAKDTTLALYDAGEDGEAAMQRIGAAASIAAADVAELGKQAEQAAQAGDKNSKGSGRKLGGSRRLGNRQYFELLEAGEDEIAARFKELAEAWGGTLAPGGYDPRWLNKHLDELVRKASEQVAASKAPQTTQPTAPAAPTYSAPQPQAQATRTVRIELALPNGQTTSGTFDNNSAEQVVRMLSSVGRTS